MGTTIKPAAEQIAACTLTRLYLVPRRGDVNTQQKPTCFIEVAR